MPEHFGEFADIRRQLGDVREDIGELKAGLAAIEKSFARVEGKIDANQRANENAHKAQDDRIGELRERMGTHAGERAATHRIGAALIAIIAGVCGALTEFIAHTLASLMGKH